MANQTSNVIEPKTPTQAPNGKALGACKVPLSTIHVDSTQNARTKLDGIPALAASISSQGLLEPLIVRDALPEDKTSLPYVLIAGYRRMAAMQSLKYAGLVDVSCRDVKRSRRLANLVENVGRAELELWDLAEAVRKLRDEDKLSVKNIAAASTLSSSHVSNCYSLATKLCDEAKGLWQKYRVPMGMLLSVISQEPDKQISLLKAWAGSQAPAKDGKRRRAKKGEPTTKLRGKGEIAEHLAKLCTRQEDTPSDETKGKIAALRWVMQERGTL